MVYMFFADGFEEVEALCPLDIMRRAGIEVTTVGVGSRLIVGAHRICISTDITDEDYMEGDTSAELIFLPGGMPGTTNLDATPAVHHAIDRAIEDNSYIAAICAAPSILGRRGLLRSREAICYPGLESKLEGAIISDKRLVLDGKILTAAGMGVALEMALYIVELLVSKEKAQTIRHSIIAD